MEEEFRAWLITWPALRDLIGDRATWGVRPQGKPVPAVTLHLVGSGRGYTMKGRDGLQGPRVQIDCWGSSAGEAILTKRAVIEALDAWSIPAQRAAFILGERGESERGDAPAANGATNFHKASLDVRVWHSEI